MLKFQKNIHFFATYSSHKQSLLRKIKEYCFRYKILNFTKYFIFNYLSLCLNMNQMKKYLLMIIALFLFSAGSIPAQNEMFKALFMYNFAKNIEWPVSYRQGDFVIGVLGNDVVYDELKRVAERKLAGSQTIVVKKYSSVADIERCHMLYIPTSKSSSLPQVLTLLKNEPTVIITDKAGYATRGACINYTIVNGDQKFELNRNNMEARGLKVTNFLMELAINVN
jgi:hypothetical protein